jgi:hypothetical protein
MIWLFDRGLELVTMEVRRCEPGYELLVQHQDGTRSVQAVGTAAELLEQVELMPRALFTDGWRPKRSTRAAQ